MFDVLQDVGVLQSNVHVGWLKAMVSECRACSKQLTRSCQGWRVVVDPARPIQFSTAEYRGHFVRVDLSVASSFERAKPGREAEWEAAPVAASTVALTVFVDGADDPAERHHLDFAEASQPGPLWHLQTGGNPPGQSKFETSWLKIPRWPIAPADIVLACEVVLMNFFESDWNELRGDGLWTNLVQRSEDLLLSGYQRHLASYLALGKAGQRNGTWLDMQTEQNWPSRAT
jgi:hypothetical protein